MKFAKTQKQEKTRGKMRKNEKTTQNTTNLVVNKDCNYIVK